LLAFEATALCVILISVCCLVQGNNEVLQGDTLFGVVIVGITGAVALGATVATKWALCRFFIDAEFRRVPLWALWLVWTAGILATAHAGRSIAVGELLPMIREDVIMTGLGMIAAAVTGVLSATAVWLGVQLRHHQRRPSHP
jgi:hypothetical protein